MQTRNVKIDDIVVGERFRVDLGDLQELSESIKEKGVIQPLSVCALPDGKFRLLAGGRRLAASRIVGLDEVPCVVRAIADELDAREIELFENIHRLDLTWLERNALVECIHTLYSERYPDGQWKWSMRKTGELLGLKSKGDISEILQVNKAISLLPELKECKSQD